MKILFLISIMGLILFVIYLFCFHRKTVIACKKHPAKKRIPLITVEVHGDKNNIEWIMRDLCHLRSWSNGFDIVVVNLADKDVSYILKSLSLYYDFLLLTGKVEIPLATGMIVVDKFSSPDSIRRKINSLLQ